MPWIALTAMFMFSVGFIAAALGLASDLWGRRIINHDNGEV
jgi:hypothetical protein